MRRKLRRIAYLSFIVSGCVVSTGCSSDDTVVTPTEEVGEEKPKPEVPETPKAKATVSLTVGEVGTTTIALQVDATDAVEVYYLLEKKETATEAWTGEEVFERGVVVKEVGKAFVVGELSAGTVYRITAAAKNEEGVITLLEQAVEVTTAVEKATVSLQLSQVSATHERVLFTVHPQGAIQVSYAIVEKGEVRTVDQVLAEGAKVYNLQAASNLRPKVAKPDTDYVLYVAGLAADGSTVLEQVEVRTEKAPDEAGEDGVLRLTSAAFTVDKTTLGGSVDV